jgi:hypothetical protein
MAPLKMILLLHQVDIRGRQVAQGYLELQDDEYDQTYVGKILKPVVRAGRSGF